MRTRSLAVPVAAFAAAIFLITAVVIAATTTLVVYPGNLEGWQPVTTAGASPSPVPSPMPPSVGFVNGPAEPPLGSGSAELRVGSDGSASAQLRQPNFAGAPLPNPSPDPEVATPPNELAGLSYSTYVQGGGSADKAPYLILNIDLDNDDTTVEDLLFFEPADQQCDGACVVTGQWQTWDAFNGFWYSRNDGDGGATLFTLRDYRARPGNDSARVINDADGLGGVRIVAGTVTGVSAGSWDNFVGNVDAFTITLFGDSDVGANTTVYDFEAEGPPTPPTTTSFGVIIGELRTSGPGLTEQPTEAPQQIGATRGGGAQISARGGRIGVEPGEQNAPACCDGDEYVELYNTNDTDISIISSDGSSGWALVKRGDTCLDEAQVVAVIPNGTTIPARGHLLLAGDEYSLSNYPAGNGDGSFATPDLTFSGTIEGDRSIGLFNSATSFSSETRLDAVGFDAGSGGTCDQLSEGAELLAPRDSIAEYAFVRRLEAGTPQDTGNNAADFVLVSTTPELSIGDNPSPVLGAPGPENTSSPVNRNATIATTLLAPTIAASQAPNRVRDTSTSDTCATLGTLTMRRTYTNNTSSPVTRLRFRLVDITTFNSPNVTGGAQAVLTVLGSSDETLDVPGRGNVRVRGLTREEPPFQTCGGLNTTLSEDETTLASPLMPGASLDVSFRAGVEQGGRFRFFVNIEALP